MVKNKLRRDFKFGKNMNTLLLVAFALVVISAILYNLPFEVEISPTTTTTVAKATTTTTPPPLPPPPAPTKGTLVIALKDEDQKIPGGAVVKSMNFTVIGIEVYLGKAAEDEGEEESGEWVVMLDEEKTLDLLKYTTTLAKIAEKETEAGAYNKIKLELSDGTVSIVHTAVGIYRPKIYTLAVQEETTVDYEFDIVEGATLTLILDFDVPNSVRRTGVGYSLTPVIVVSEQAGQAANVEEI